MTLKIIFHENQFLCLYTKRTRIQNVSVELGIFVIVSKTLGLEVSKKYSEGNYFYWSENTRKRKV